MRLVDTDVAIDYLRGRPEAVRLIQGLAADDVWLGASEITRFEVLAGSLPRERAATERLFARLGWLPVGEAVSRRAASLAQEHRTRNVGIEDSDYLIGATALEFDLFLLTRNVRHFPMLPRLEPAY